ncbi:hypothetical protein WIW50_07065 [Flavobacteriaceae bacterium 3-367]
MKLQAVLNLIANNHRVNEPVVHTISPKTNCAEEDNHDFYCDAEKPFVQF